jgi:hypothetical protein
MDSVGFQRIASRVMTRVAASMDELWRNLQDAGVTNHLGMRDPRDLQHFLAQQGQGGLEQIGGATGNIQDDQTRQQVQGSMQNYIAGRMLGEEIAKVRQQAASEGRQPTVAEMRAARMAANQRLMQEGSAEWMGMPQQFQTGTRGPLRREPTPTTVTLPRSPLTDDRLSQIASDIYSGEVMRARLESQRRYDEGLSDTWEPAAADMRSAIRRTNQALTEMGYPWVQLHVGSRGRFPRGGPGVVEVVEQPEQFWAKERHRRRNEELGREREQADRKRENLGLDPTLDIGDGNVVVPSPDPDFSDNEIPEETEVEQREQEKFPSIVQRKRQQMAYQPRPALHQRCRCTILDLVGGQVWKTAGDDRVCEHCRANSEAFNSLVQGV